MKKESILYGVIGILAGALIAGFSAAYAVNNNRPDIMRAMGMRTNTTNQGMMSDTDMSMGEMTNMLKSKTGDDFDAAFIEQMIVHHQGAIDMANLAKLNAKHNEIKKLAEDILSAQSKEIEMMKTWQIQWGYKTSTNNSDGMMDMMGH